MSIMVLRHWSRVIIWCWAVMDEMSEGTAFDRWLRISACMETSPFVMEALPTSVILPPTHSTPATGFVLKADLSYSVFLWALLRAGHFLEGVTLTFKNLEFCLQKCVGERDYCTCASCNVTITPSVSHHATMCFHSRVYTRKALAVQINELECMRCSPKHTHTSVFLSVVGNEQSSCNRLFGLVWR